VHLLSGRPARGWKQWKQKERHYKQMYKPAHKIFLLGLYRFRIFVLPAFIIVRLFCDGRAGRFRLRLILQGIILFTKLLKNLMRRSISIYWILDIWMFFLLHYFSTSLFKNQQKLEMVSIVLRFLQECFAWALHVIAVREFGGIKDLYSEWNQKINVISHKT